MSEPTTEDLMAYADGELDLQRAQAVEAAMARDPAVAAEVEAFRADRRCLVAAFSGVLDEAPPQRLVEAVRGGPAEATDLAEARARRELRARGAAWAGWAMAACFVGGVALGLAPQLLRDPSLVAGDGGLVARGALARNLDRQLSGEASDALIRVGLSFRSNTGAFCRTFQTGSESPVAGVACREAGRWQVRMAVSAQPSARADYRQAAADLPTSVLEAVEGMIEGAPLDAAQEASARARGWR